MEKVRVQKFFSDCGVLSRRAAEEEIKKGLVTINGKVATLGDKVHPITDVVKWKLEVIKPTFTEKKYILINKPRGYITSMNDPQGRKCVTELVKEFDERLYPVGRLDLLSEGCLIMTNDGEIANKLMHPSKEVEKMYRVKVSGLVDEKQYDTLTSPLNIDGYTIKPAKVQIVSQDKEDGTVLHITIHEGRNRQIRKMCQIAHLNVKRLCRISIGKIKLNGLTTGKWRELDDEEIQYLKTL